MSTGSSDEASLLPAFFDTRTRRITPLAPVRRGRVGVYTCGPTVYRYAHIGNLRSFILADIVARTCEFTGLQVRQVVNITDVGHMTDEVADAGDDKMLLAAEVEGKTPAQIADFYTSAFLEDCALAGIRPAAEYPRASDNIPEMIELARRLIERGHAYVSGGSVYYDVTTFPTYGSLSGNSLDKLRAGHRRIIDDPGKRHPEDFLLWKAAGPRRLVRFDSPWGEGYPGWHIECSAMSMKYLGEEIDIHTAGIDLTFPHHEDEIAQSDGAVGHRVVGHWIHGEHLLMSGNKMAKSSGNVLRISDIAQGGIDPLAFRLLTFGARYRKQIHFSQDALVAADTALRRLRSTCASLPDPANWAPNRAPGDVSPAARDADTEFRSAILSDLDMPRAIRVLHSISANARILGQERSGLMREWDSVLGLDMFREAASAPAEPSKTDEEIEILVEERRRARAAGDYERADKVRDDLIAEGVALADSSTGTTWSRVTSV